MDIGTIEVVKCDSCDKPATVNYANVYTRWAIVDGEYIQPGESITTEDSEHFCEEHDPLTK